jgi:hypothetical protein
MKTFSHLRQYLAEFFLEWETFQRNTVEKIKIHILRSITFFQKWCRLWEDDRKHGGAGETTRDFTIWRIRVASWISKATCTHAHAHAHALGHPQARTHRKIFNICCFCTAKIIRESASVLRCTYIACLVFSVNVIFIYMTTLDQACNMAAVWKKIIVIAL